MFAVVSGFVLHLLLTAALFPPSKGIGTWPFTNVHQSMPPPLSRVWRLMKARWTCLCELRQPLLSMPSRCPRLATASRVLSVRSVRQACGDSTEQEKKKATKRDLSNLPQYFSSTNPTCLPKLFRHLCAFPSWKTPPLTLMSFLDGWYPKGQWGVESRPCTIVRKCYFTCLLRGGMWAQLWGPGCPNFCAPSTCRCSPLYSARTRNQNALV